ncbi:MAG: hypothetical protein GF421_09010 [Candidatus Aminicenantes bacterium]|nr:hypothetical protein [Candidatus Aminicenantes bacterium]
MKNRMVFVFSFLVLCLFVLTLCAPKEEATKEEETSAVVSQPEETQEMTEKEELMAKMNFSDDVEDYLLSRDWEVNPKDLFLDHLTQLKAELEKNYEEAPKILNKIEARMEDDSDVLNMISGEEIPAFFQKYPDRNLKIDICCVCVERIYETKYVMVDNEKVEVDLIAYVVLQYRLVDPSEGMNQGGYITMGCYHRNDCQWGCDF